MATVFSILQSSLNVFLFFSPEELKFTGSA